MINSSLPAIDRAKELLSYDPATGLFTWLVTRGRSAKAGSIAGTRDRKGYILIGIDGRYCPAHRLAWAFTHGTWPTFDIDHRDLDKGNNRISNLREATRSNNMANTAAHRDSATGIKGIVFDERRGRWYAMIMKDGKRHWLGYHPDKEAARAAYRIASERLFGEFARAA